MAADTLYWRIKLKAGAAVLGLDLPLIGGNVYGQLFPSESAGYSFASGKVQDVVFPAVLLTSEGETEELLPGESEGLAGIFPLRCWVADRADPNQHAREKDYLTARKTLQAAFHQQRLAGVPEVVSCEVRPQVIFDPRLPSYQHVISGMVLLFRWGQSRY